jgi:hypothetical protein
MLDDYYAIPNVRERLLEFLGGTSLDQVTCVYIIADDQSPDVKFVPRPVVVAVQEILLRHGIVLLHLMGGRGHHFV